MRVRITAWDDQPPRLVRLTDDTYAASGFTAQAEHTGDMPCAVTMRVEVNEGGPRVTALTLSGRSITTEDLRAVPLARLRDIATDLASFRPLHNEAGELTGGAWSEKDQTAALRQRRRVINEDHLRQVADIYLAAKSEPTTTVAGKFDVPRSTAARWVQQARAAGMLPPAKKGRDPR